MSLNTELSELFATLSALMEIKGESPFKAIAFSKVSRIIKDSTMDLRQAVENKTLKDIEGIGPSSQKIIEQYIQTGHSGDFDEVAASVPPGLIPMLQIPGLGPKTIAMFWKERNVLRVEDLVKAIDEGRLAGLKGVGEKKIDAIRQGIALRAQAKGRVAIVEAMPVGQSLVKRLRDLPEVKQAEVAGSLRRCRETIGDVDLVCALSNPGAGQAVSDAFVAFPEVQRILGQGPTKASVVTASGLQVDLRIVPAACFGATLLYFTGSKDHNVKLRGMALDKKLTLNEWGLYRLEEYEKSPRKAGVAPSVASVAGKTEEQVYRALGMPWIDPLLREDRGEIEAALAGKLPDLIELGDIRGDLHSHTTASDGQASIEQMAEAAMEMKYEFLAITDHSQSQIIANGLSADRLLKHARAIRKAAEHLKGLTLLAGCEVDILADGRLDFEPEVLAELDFVVASPHVALKQDVDKATDRLLRAIDARYVNVIGHPTGRMIAQREGLPLHWDRIYKAAAESGTALEINAGYPRLDLSDVHARGAIAAGVQLSINTDAHSTEGFGDMIYGVQVARRGWVTAADVINCLPVARLRSFLAKKRK